MALPRRFNGRSLAKKELAAKCQKESHWIESHVDLILPPEFPEDVGEEQSCIPALYFGLREFVCIEPECPNGKKSQDGLQEILSALHLAMQNIG